jgi:hypothetical protein
MDPDQVTLWSYTGLVILYFRTNGSAMYDRLLFPTDGSEGASIAFDHVLDIAAAHDVTVRIFNVADTTQRDLASFQQNRSDGNRTPYMLKETSCEMGRAYRALGGRIPVRFLRPMEGYKRYLSQQIIDSVPGGT